jgi:hypothetical protein
MKNMYKKLFILLLIVVGSSCQFPDDTVNPSTLSPTAADPDLLMNAIQINFASFYNSASANTDQLVRMNAMTGGFRYQNAISPASTNGLWSLAYQSTLNNIKTLIPIAQARNLTTHVAMAKIFQAYIYLTLVDIYGDVPQSEALAGISDFSPKLDNGSDVYALAIALLGEARTELAKTGADAGRNITAINDKYYGGSRANWTALANSLELRAWMNIRTLPARVAEADARITTLIGGSLIDAESKNFTFKYGITTVPNSRHPLYDQYYGPNFGGAGGYIANYFLNELYNGLGVQDPRWRYYFYRQIGSIKPNVAGFDPKGLGCNPGTPPAHYVAAGTVYCVFEPGFYGRDHGDASGTPPDGGLVTAAGVYPAGGRIDDNPTANRGYNVQTIRGDGANGAGIQPIFMSFFVDFLKAEWYARKGDPATALTNMINGVNNSITQVRNFATSKRQTTTLEPSTSAYLTALNSAYAAATDKVNVIAREFYVSLWGNGIEAYDLYRRTGAPTNFQPTRQLNPGPWVRSFVYPLTYVSLANPDAVKDPNVVNKVFWDGNPNTLN